MRTFLPMVCLLARVVVGNMEIGSNLSDMTRPRNENNDELENRTEKPGPWMDDALKEWNNGEPDISLAMETDRKEVDPDGSETEMADETKGKSVNLLKIVAKRREEETMDSWLDATTNDKDSSQEKRDPWMYWWEGKRTSSHGQSQGIRRPIRVPFNRWGGKRGRATYPRHPDNDHVGVSVDGYGSKRKAGSVRNGWKIPFSSWAGKRARNSNARDEDGDEDEVRNQDRENYSDRPSMSMPMTMRSPYLDLSVGSTVPVHHILGLVADEFPKKEKAERFRDKNEMAAKDEGWAGKPNNFPYQKTSENNGNWFVQTYRLIATKTAQPERNKMFTSAPFHGKRNSKPHALRFGDEYLETPRRSGAKDGPGFFPWGG